MVGRWSDNMLHLKEGPHGTQRWLNWAMVKKMKKKKNKKANRKTTSQWLGFEPANSARAKHSNLQTTVPCSPPPILSAKSPFASSSLTREDEVKTDARLNEMKELGFSSKLIEMNWCQRTRIGPSIWSASSSPWTLGIAERHSNPWLWLFGALANDH